MYEQGPRGLPDDCNQWGAAEAASTSTTRVDSETQVAMPTPQWLLHDLKTSENVTLRRHPRKSVWNIKTLKGPLHEDKHAMKTRNGSHADTRRCLPQLGKRQPRSMVEG